jgi:microsomal epoxide hydrolase
MMKDREDNNAQAGERLPDVPSNARPELSSPGFAHRFANVDGVRLHYVRGGRPGGDTIVLLAGFPQSWYAWRQVMPCLASTHDVIAIDLPGQGDSDRPDGGYDTGALAAKVHALLQQLGVNRYGLAAHDVGAWVAYPLAARYGSEVRALALLDAGIPGVTLPDRLPVAPEQAWRTWHFAFHVIPDLPEMLIAGHEREYLAWFLRRKAADPSVFSEKDLMNTCASSRYPVDCAPAWPITGQRPNPHARTAHSPSRGNSRCPCWS